jgi:YesN/AraC family two-component response regulator
VDPAIEVVGEASMGREAFERARRLSPDFCTGHPYSR